MNVLINEHMITVEVNEMGIFKAMKWSNLVSGILLVLLGILMLFMPRASLTGLSVVISIAVLISGIMELINYFATDKEDRSGWALAEGIIETLLGVWMVFGSGSSVLTSIIPYVFAIFIFASGIVRVAESLELKSYGSTRWGWLLAFGILAMILGVLLCFAPMISAAFVTTALSLLLICHGISNIMLYYNMQRVGNFVRKRLDDIRQMEEP